MRSPSWIGSIVSPSVAVLLPIDPLLRNHAAHAPAWIIHIACIARDQVYVAMHDGLPCSCFHVDAHIKSRGGSVLRQFLHQSCLYLLHQLPHRLLCSFVQRKIVGLTYPWDDQRMPFADRVGIAKSYRQCIFSNELVAGEAGAEGAGGGGQSQNWYATDNPSNMRNDTPLRSSPIKPDTPNRLNVV